MSDCNFKIPFTGSIEDTLNKAKSAVESQGGNFTRTETGGAFDVNILGNAIAGSYILHEQMLEMTILSKPFFIPCSTIESFLIKQLG